MSSSPREVTIAEHHRSLQMPPPLNPEDRPSGVTRLVVKEENLEYGLPTQRAQGREISGLSAHE